MNSRLLGKLLLPFSSLGIAWAVVGGQPARAILTFNIYQSGPDVVVDVSGSLSLSANLGQRTACVIGPSGSTGGSISSNVICTGPSNFVDTFSISGPTSLSSGVLSVSPADATSGTTVLLVGSAQLIGVESSYVSGAPLLSSARFNGRSLADFGFNTSGLIGTWTLTGTGGGDTINLVVGNPPSAVPGPLPLFGAAAAFGFSRRLRRRVSLNRSASPSAPSISA